MSEHTTAPSRSAEIRLVAGRELRTQLLKKSSLISTLVVLVLGVAGILVAAHFSGDKDEPYRLGVSAPDAAGVSALTPALEQLRASGDKAVEVVDVSGQDSSVALGIGDDAPDAVVDAVLDLTGDSPRFLVPATGDADAAVVAGTTEILQRSALAEQITALGGDPAQVSGALTTAAPRVVALDPPQHDSAGFGARYTVLSIMDVVLFIVIMGGGQIIAMGVVEEKSSRIVEILLACVRPTSLLAGKVLGTGVAVVVSWGLILVATGATAAATGLLPEGVIDVDAVLAVMIAWMVIGFVTAAVAYGAAGSLVSRQEDVANVTMPLTMILMVPYMATFAMATGDPSLTIYRVLSYIPPFSAFLMPARLVLGVSSWVEQTVALVIALVCIPLLVRLAATIYTRAVTRTGSRVPLKEVLGRAAGA